MLQKRKKFPLVLHHNAMLVNRNAVVETNVIGDLVFV